MDRAQSAESCRDSASRASGKAAVSGGQWKETGCMRGRIGALTNLVRRCCGHTLRNVAAQNAVRGRYLVWRMDIGKRIQEYVCSTVAVWRKCDENMMRFPERRPQTLMPKSVSLGLCPAWMTIFCTARRVIQRANNGVPSRTDCHRCPLFQFPIAPISTACIATLSTTPLIHIPSQGEIRVRFPSLSTTLNKQMHQRHGVAFKLVVTDTPPPSLLCLDLPRPPPSLHDRHITPPPRICAPQHTSNSHQFLHHFSPVSFIYAAGPAKKKFHHLFSFLSIFQYNLFIISRIEFLRSHPRASASLNLEPFRRSIFDHFHPHSISRPPLNLQHFTPQVRQYPSLSYIRVSKTNL